VRSYEDPPEKFDRSCTSRISTSLKVGRLPMTSLVVVVVYFNLAVVEPNSVPGIHISITI